MAFRKSSPFGCHGPRLATHASRGSLHCWHCADYRDPHEGVNKSGNLRYGRYCLVGPACRFEAIGHGLQAVEGDIGPDEGVTEAGEVDAFEDTPEASLAGADLLAMRMLWALRLCHGQMSGQPEQLEGVKFEQRRDTQDGRGQGGFARSRISGQPAADGAFAGVEALGEGAPCPLASAELL